MHLLHIIDSLAPGGAERMLVDLANAAHRDGHQVSVCVTRSDTRLAEELASGIDLLVLRRQRRFDLAAIVRLGRWLKAHPVDLLHAHSRSTVALLAFGKTLGLLPRTIPLLMHDHFGIEVDDRIPRWFRWWGRHFVVAYVGVYAKLGEWARRAGLPERRVFVLQNALDFRRLQQPSTLNIRAEFDLPADEPVGVTVAGIRPVKGIDLLIEALGKQTKPFRFVIVGGVADQAYFDHCRALCTEHGLDGRVIFTGARADVPALLAGCDFAVIPSRSESGPLVLIEVVAAKLPFICTQVGGIAETISRQDPSSFVPPDDVDALAAALDVLLCLTAEQRQTRGVNNVLTVHNNFNVDQAVKRWYDVYAFAIRESTQGR